MGIRIRMIQVLTCAFWVLTASLTSAQSALEYRVLAPISDMPILPSTRLSAFPDDGTLRLSAAQGETEPASLVVRWVGANKRSIALDVSALSSSAGTLPAEIVDPKHVLTWYQAPGAWESWRRIRRGASDRLVPELLANDPDLVRVDQETRHNALRLGGPESSRYERVSERALTDANVIRLVKDFPLQDAPGILPVELEPNRTHQIWLTFRVPRGAESGVYSGELRFRAGDEIALVVPISLTVHPFELDPPSIEYSMYYRGKLVPGPATLSHDWKTEEQLLEDLRMMLDHGVSNPTVYQRLYHKLPRERTSSIDAEALIARHLSIRKEAGIDAAQLYYLGRLIGRKDTAKARRQLREDIVRLRTLASGFGSNELFLYGVDEATGEGVTRQRKLWRFVQSLGARVFAAGKGEHVLEAAGTTDLLVYRGNESRSLQLRTIGAQKAVGRRTFMYANPQTGPENPLVWRRNYGLWLWQLGYDGAMPFAYQSQFGDFFNDWDHKNYRTHALAYPTVDRPLATIAFAGFREGVDDVRYVTTLSNRLESIDVRDNPAATEARAWLESLRGAAELDPDLVRRRVVEFLERLEEADVVGLE